jgi:hypothetical protein
MVYRDGGMKVTGDDLLLRISPLSVDAYAFTLLSPWSEWQGEGALPEFVRRYAASLRKPYAEPAPHELREIAVALWEEFVLESIPEPGWEAIGPLSWITGVRLDLRDPLLHYLPWEHMPAFRRGHTYPLRYTPPRFETPAMVVEPPLRVLFVSANPARSKMAFHEGEELYHLEEGLKEVAGESVEVVPLLGASVEELRETLTGGGEWYPVLHFAGHGYLPASGPLLALETQRRSDFISPAELGGVARAGGVRLLTLQTPVNVPNYHIAAFAAFAASTDAHGLPAVLFETRRDDKRVTDVARAYAALARGKPLARACAIAKTWAGEGSPILGAHLHARSDTLFERPTPLTLPTKGLHDPHPIQGKPKEEVPIGKPRIGTELEYESTSPRPPSKELLQQIDYVQENIRHLERMRRTYAKAEPSWLEEELTEQRERLDHLHGRLGKGV